MRLSLKTIRWQTYTGNSQCFTCNYFVSVISDMDCKVGEYSGITIIKTANMNCDWLSAVINKCPRTSEKEFAVSIPLMAPRMALVGKSIWISREFDLSNSMWIHTQVNLFQSHWVNKKNYLVCENLEGNVVGSKRKPRYQWWTSPKCSWWYVIRKNNFQFNYTNINTE